MTSANIACGFHAGDPATMRRVVQAAAARGVQIGAHPGLPDLQGFGRRVMQVSPADAYAMVVYQVGALAGFARAAGTRLNHVKPHGALYNMAAPATARWPMRWPRRCMTSIRRWCSLAWPAAR